VSYKAALKLSYNVAVFISTQSKIASSVHVAEVVAPTSITDVSVPPALDINNNALVTAIGLFSGFSQANEIALAAQAFSSISMFFLFSLGSRFLFLIILFWIVYPEGGLIPSDTK
jgi:hypothetical protein